MRRTFVVSPLAALLVAAVVVLPGASAWASVVTFGIQPAPVGSAQPSADFTFGVTDGATVSDSVEVVNYSPTPLTLQIGAADAVQATDGGFGLVAANVKSMGVGAWVRFARPELRVTLPGAGPGGPAKQVIPFLLRVPDNASPGDHAGAILATLQTVGTSKAGKKIILDQRVGARVFVTVSGATRTGLSVEDLSTSVLGGTAPWQHDALRVNYSVVNTGNVNVSLAQTVSASGLIADHGRVSVPTNPLVLPGGVVRESVTVPALWREFFTHVVVSAAGTLLSVNGAHETVRASASAWVASVPWVDLLIVFVIAVLVVIWRRRRGAGQAVVDEGGSS